MTSNSDRTSPAANDCGPKPAWLRVRLGGGTQFEATRERIRVHGLHTVCRAALCPNLGACWSQGHATVLILGEVCTRGCAFCNVERRTASAPDPGEPQRVARAVRASGLREVVLTSVTRDDLPDGGAAHWVETIECVRAAAPGIRIEVLVPDFQGDPKALDAVIQTRPAVFGHNLETVPRLYETVRSRADYARSLDVLQRAAAAGLIVKTALMLGLGETPGEVHAVLRDARDAGCRIVFMGQYLRPGPRHHPVARYVTPAEFEHMGARARAMGFDVVASAPLVRSSMQLDAQTEFVRAAQSASRTDAEKSACTSMAEVEPIRTFD